MNRFLLDKKQWLVIGLLIVSFFLVMDLNSRLSDLFRLTSARDVLNKELSQLQITRDSLETQIAYATSDQAVNDWAREYGGLGQTGDIPVIPLPPRDYTLQPALQPTPTPQMVDHWQKWWALFFGN